VPPAARESVIHQLSGGLARTNDGRQRAKARGVKFKPALNTYQAEEARRMLKKGKTQSEIGRLLGVTPNHRAAIGRLKRNGVAFSDSKFRESVARAPHLPGAEGSKIKIGRGGPSQTQSF
jgi:hypothetical protein